MFWCLFEKHLINQDFAILRIVTSDFILEYLKVSSHFLLIDIIYFLIDIYISTYLLKCRNGSISCFELDGVFQVNALVAKDFPVDI